MKLTPNEIVIADRCLSKRERQLAQWPQLRWLILVIFSISIVFGFRMAHDGMQGIADDRSTDADISHAIGDAPAAGTEYRWTVGTMMKISKVLELRHQVVTYSLIQAALGYVQIISGAIMIYFVIVRWKPSEKDALICKLLREKLREFQSGRSSEAR